MRIQFQQISRPAYKSGKCRCGVTRTRQTTITCTVNPFNKNAAGVPKSPEEVLDDVIKKVELWKSEPIYCDNCRPLETPEELLTKFVGLE